LFKIGGNMKETTKYKIIGYNFCTPIKIGTYTKNGLVVELSTNDVEPHLVDAFKMYGVTVGLKSYGRSKPISEASKAFATREEALAYMQSDELDQNASLYRLEQI